VICAEDDLARLDIAIVSIPALFVNLTKEHSKNIGNSQSQINSMNYINETIERPLSFLVKEKADPLKSVILTGIIASF
jgi:hypothetical protein